MATPLPANPLKSIANSIQAPMQSITKNIQENVNGLSSQMKNTIGQFSSPSAVAPGSPPSLVPAVFLTSNSIIAKIGFIIVVLIVFMYALSLGVSLLGYLLQASSSPYIVYGTLDGFDNKIIPSDPKQPNSIQVGRSNNQTTGAEFSWSVWLNIRNNKSGPATYQHIFNKGDTNFNKSSSVASVNNAPGLYLTSNGDSGEAILHVIMDTVDPSVGPQIIDVQGIPYNQWVHVLLRLENKMLDVYVNGVITNRFPLPAVPKQNYMDINLCQNGGFSGQLSNLRYYNYALSVFEINAVVLGGPNTSPSSMSSRVKAKGNPYFLSSLWYNTQYSK